jgi:hypothetical protein
VRAARSSKRLRVARELQAVNGITEAGLGEHEGCHTRCAAGPAVTVEEAIANVPGVLPWFGPAMAAALHPVQAQLAAALQPVQAQLNNIATRVSNNEARIINSDTSDSLDAFMALTNQAGVAFADFPANFSSLVLLNGVQMTAILNHYGLPFGGGGEQSSETPENQDIHWHADWRKSKRKMYGFFSHVHMAAHTFSQISTSHMTHDRTIVQQATGSRLSIATLACGRSKINELSIVNRISGNICNLIST